MGKPFSPPSRDVLPAHSQLLVDAGRRPKASPAASWLLGALTIKRAGGRVLGRNGSCSSIVPGWSAVRMVLGGTAFSVVLAPQLCIRPLARRLASATDWRWGCHSFASCREFLVGRS